MPRSNFSYVDESISLHPCPISAFLSNYSLSRVVWEGPSKYNPAYADRLDLCVIDRDNEVMLDQTSTGLAF